MILCRILLLSTTLLLGFCLTTLTATATTNSLDKLPEPEILNDWIEQMKQHHRGPFKRIRWFCNDGTILPPKPYACREHGGGVQHGEWTDQIKQLRQHNYLIANLLADLSPDTFFQQPHWQNQLKQIILEHFLREADDGWIFRQTRYYRGSVQAEDENRHGRSLLLSLLQQTELQDRHFLMLREAVRYLPHGQETPTLTAMRQLAQTLAEKDPEFSPLRVKLHNQPGPADATRVRAYAKKGLTELQDDYRKLAQLIDEITNPKIDSLHEAIRLQVSRDPQLIEVVNRATTDSFDLPAEVRYGRTSQLLVEIRDNLNSATDYVNQLQWLDLSLNLEQDLYRTANQLVDRLPTATRYQRLAWIELGVDALYGTGTLSKREWKSLKNSLRNLLRTPLSVEAYHSELAHLSHATRWAENRLRFHFETPMTRLAKLDPDFNIFIPERLRGSPLLPISRMIDSLLSDSQQLRGVNHQLFGKPTSGLQPLNPGLARGRLEIVENPNRHDFFPDGIYLLPETVESLPPVAGILTRGAGNALSHIQLLARNLGIPNIAVDKKLQAQLTAKHGETIVVAVSRGGVIRIEKDNDYWQEIFRQKQQQPDFLIEPELNKLDLQQSDIINLDRLRASDSGRIAGPKSANLGELRQHYRELVPDALIIPFGRFRQLLDQTTAPDGQSLWGWMRKSYRQLAKKPDTAAQNDFLARLREEIINAPFEQGFLDQLRTTLDHSFGLDGSYGVFVRSDTNVEDLPNFTGAGLNKTVPHVVGFDNIVRAIKIVWASPFTERAYRWRQSHMRAPEQVYASVLLMLSVPAEKSGVMATIDPATGDNNFLQVAVNEGVGGAVSGQRAEEIIISRKTGKVRLLAQASADRKRILLSQGGIQKIPATAPEQLLTDAEIETLRRMADELPARFPELVNPDGSHKPADIEFGFVDGRFVLFQIRPLVESKRVRKDLILKQLDAEISKTSATVILKQIPEVPTP